MNADEQHQAELEQRQQLDEAMDHLKAFRNHLRATDAITDDLDWLIEFNRSHERVTQLINMLLPDTDERRVPQIAWKVNCISCGAYIREHTGVCKPAETCRKCDSANQQDERDFGNFRYGGLS